MKDVINPADVLLHILMNKKDYLEDRFGTSDIDHDLFENAMKACEEELKKDNDEE